MAAGHDGGIIIPAVRTLSRRQFGGVVAALPLAALASRAAAAESAVGVATSSFRELPRVTGHDNVDDVIRALQAVRATVIELAFANAEPAPPSVAPVLGGSAAYPRRIVLTPEQIAATNSEARAALRAWRLDAGEAACAAAGAKFRRAGIGVHACALAYDDSFTDEEIDATFRLAKQLGAPAISAPMTLKTAARLAPFADRHRMAIAIHNQAAANAAGAIDAAQIDEALALCPAFRLALDIGNVTASNGDALAVLRRHRARVSHVILKDRLRNGGASQPFGEGDTPVGAAVADAARAPAIPALVEYDYVGLRPALDEVAASLRYAANASRSQ